PQFPLLQSVPVGRRRLDARIPAIETRRLALVLVGGDRRGLGRRQRRRVVLDLAPTGPATAQAAGIVAAGVGHGGYGETGGEGRSLEPSPPGSEGLLRVL